MMVWYFQTLWLMRTIQDRTNCCGSFEYWQGKFHNSHKHLLNWKLIHFCLPGNYTSRDEWFKKKCCSSREASESGPKVNCRFINLIGNDTSRSRVSVSLDGIAIKFRVDILNESVLHIIQNHVIITMKTVLKVNRFSGIIKNWWNGKSTNSLWLDSV